MGRASFGVHTGVDEGPSAGSVRECVVRPGISLRLDKVAFGPFLTFSCRQKSSTLPINMCCISTVDPFFYPWHSRMPAHQRRVRWCIMLAALGDGGHQTDQVQWQLGQAGRFRTPQLTAKRDGCHVCNGSNSVPRNAGCMAHAKRSCMCKTPCKELKANDGEGDVQTL